MNAVPTNFYRNSSFSTRLHKAIYAICTATHYGIKRNPTILNRNHFIESDWLYNNSQHVKNVSREYAPTEIRHVVIDKKAWLKKVHKIDSKFEAVEINLEYIPYEHTEQIAVDKTMIVLFVADNPKIRDKIGTDLAVVHMGFILPDGTLRHASSECGAVVDVPLTEYLNARKQNKSNIGIALVEIK